MAYSYSMHSARDIRAKTYVIPVCMYASLYVYKHVWYVIWHTHIQCIQPETFVRKRTSSLYVCMHPCMYACMYDMGYGILIFDGLAISARDIRAKTYVISVCMHACVYVCMHVCMYEYLHVWYMIWHTHIQWIHHLNLCLLRNKDHFLSLSFSLSFSLFLFLSLSLCIP